MSQDIAIDFYQLHRIRRSEMRRAAIISGIAHLALLAAFVYSPEPSIRAPRGVVAVELVAAPARLPAPAAPPKASPAPVPRAEPKPVPAPKPKPKTVVLPAEPTTPKPKPKPVSKPVPKPVAKPKPVTPTPKPAVAPAPEQGLDDVLAQFRAESGENREPTVVASAPTSTGPVGVPTGVPISPEVATWMKRAKIHVRGNWVLQPGFRTQPLEAEVRVDLGSNGLVRGTPKVSRGSGNPWYDEGVVRAIQKSSPLPTPPDEGVWTFVFMPEDSY